MPLLITHGWPGSVVEFLDVIARSPIRRPTAASGGRVPRGRPSIPGYGFSEPPRTRGWDVQRIAAAFIELMSRLGYARYGAQGGDWGAQVTTQDRRARPRALRRHPSQHADRRSARRPRSRSPPRSRRTSPPCSSFQREETGYANEQGTKPQTLGVALNDSPAGLLAWIVEKFRAWSDCDGDPEHCFTRDQLLTNVMLYWVTRDERLVGPALLGDQAQRLWTTTPFVGVPTGVARYPKEVLRWPRSWVERQYNVTRWARHAPRRPLRRHGAARAVRRRPAGVLPNRALTLAPPGPPTAEPSRTSAISGYFPAAAQLVDLHLVAAYRRAVDQHMPYAGWLLGGQALAVGGEARKRRVGPGPTVTGSKTHTSAQYPSRR